MSKIQSLLVVILLFRYSAQECQVVIEDKTRKISNETDHECSYSSFYMKTPSCTIT